MVNGEKDEEEDLGEFRIKMFLEDLGPANVYKDSEQKIEEEIIKRGLKKNKNNENNEKMEDEIEIDNKDNSNGFGLNPRGIYI